MVLSRRVSIAAAMTAALAAPATASAAPQVELRPASGPAGSAMHLDGSGFGSRARVRVAVTGRATRSVKASRRGAFALGVTVPRRHRSLTVRTTSAGRRVTNRFSVTGRRPAAETVELATSTGARVRVSPAALRAGGALTVRGTGFSARRTVRLTVGDAVLEARTDRHGAFAHSFALPASLPGGPVRLAVKSGSARLSARLTATAAAPAPGGGTVEQLPTFELSVSTPAPDPTPAATVSATPTPTATPPPPPPPGAPVNTTPPAVTGTARAGEPLTATAGAWSGRAPIAYAFRWQRCLPGTITCTDTGDTGSTRDLTADDAGMTLRAVVTATNSAGGTDAPSAVTAPVDVGRRDFAYGPGNPSAPTGQKPSSKLFIVSGTWYGVLWSDAHDNGAGVPKGAWTVQRFSTSTQTWTDTGTVVDTRAKAAVDALYSGGRLYVVATLVEGATDLDDAVKVHTLQLTGSTWTLEHTDPVANASPETAVLDRDSTGRLWLAYTYAPPMGAKSVYVAHTDAGGRWQAPYILPVGNATGLGDDIASIVAYGVGTSRYVGVLWSNQVDNTLNFARHADTATGDTGADWEPTVLASGDRAADDHLNIKSVIDDGSGRVFAVVKTSRNDPPNPVATDPLMVLHTITVSGGHTRQTVWQVRDNVTRAILALDTTHRRVHLFAAGPCCNGGVVYTKSAGYDAPTFPGGLGTPFIQLASVPEVNNPTTTKQPVTSATGLLVEASSDETHDYVHNFLPLDG
jgi:hypothetical protein